MALGHGRTYLVGMAARSLIFTLRRPDWPAIGATWGPLIDRTKGVLAGFALRAWPGWWRGACEDPGRTGPAPAGCTARLDPASQTAGQVTGRRHGHQRTRLPLPALSGRANDEPLGVAAAVG